MKCFFSKMWIVITDSTHVCNVFNWRNYGYSVVVGYFEPCGVQSVKVIGNGDMEIHCNDPALAVDNLVERFPSISFSVRYRDVDFEPLHKIIKKAENILEKAEDNAKSPDNGVALQPASHEAKFSEAEEGSSLVRKKSASVRRTWSHKSAIVLKGMESGGDIFSKEAYDRTMKKSNLYSTIYDDSILCPYDEDCSYNKFRHRSIRSVSDHIVRDHKAEYDKQSGPKPDFYIKWDSRNLQRYLQTPITSRFVVYGHVHQRRSEMAGKMNEGKWVDDMTELSRSVKRFERPITVMNAEAFFESFFGLNAFSTLKTKALNSKMDIQCKEGVNFIAVESEPVGERLLYYCIVTKRLMKCYVGSTVQTLNARFGDHCMHNEKIREWLSVSDVKVTV